MSLASQYPVTAFSETQTFLVWNPSTQTLKRVQGSDLVSYITPGLGRVYGESTRAAALNGDYAIGNFIQTAGGSAIGDGGNGMYLVVEGGTGDYSMLNGNDLLLLPFGSLAGSDLDGALITDETSTPIEDAVEKRAVRFANLEAFRASSCSYPEVIVEAANAGTTTGRMILKATGTSAGTPTLTAARFTALAAGEIINEGGYGYALDITKPYGFHEFGAVGDGAGAAGSDNTAVQLALTHFLNFGGIFEPLPGEYQVSSLTYKPSGDQYPLVMRCKGRLRPNEPENNLSRARQRGVIFHFESISGSTIAFDIGDGTNNPQGVYIENLYLLGQNAQNVASPTDTTTGISLTLCPESVLKNVVASKFHTPLRLTNSWSTSTYNCAGVRCYYPFNLSTASNNIRMHDWKSHTAYWAGTVTAESAGITLSAPWFETLTNGLLVNNAANEVNGLTIINPHCESITNYCFELGYDAAGSQTAGNIQSVHIIGGYYNSVGSGVSNAKMRISDATSRDVIIHGEMGNFDEGQIDGNFAPVKLVRTETGDPTNAGGPYPQTWIGYKSGIADNTATDLFTITVPTGDCNFAVEVMATGNSPLGSFTAMTMGVIAIVRKAADANAYATYQETRTKVEANTGAGQSYAGVFVLSISVSTNVVTVRITADNNQSQTNQIMTLVRSIGGERSQGSVRKLIFADA